MYLYGMGVPVDRLRAIDLLMRAAVAGNQRARFQLRLIPNGDLLQLSIIADSRNQLELAVKISKHLVQEGDACAMYQLATIYERMGTWKSLYQALALYQKASLSGIEAAALNLKLLEVRMMGPERICRPRRWRI